MGKAKRCLGFGWIAAALVFLFHPNVMIIDVLPDFIGYWMICIAFSKLADLNESIGAAIALFRKMVLIDAAKILAILWIFGMTVTVERNSSILLWTFVFGVLELVFLLPAYTKLFDGIVALGYLYPNETVLRTDDVIFGKSRTDKIRNFTRVFVCVKAILPILPELADLSNVAYDEGSGVVNLYRYIGLMRAMAFIPVLIVGIIWLWKAQCYFWRLRGDGLFWKGLAEKYDADIRPKVGLFVRRRVGTTYFLLILALSLTLDFKLDGQNYLPDVLAAIVFFIMFASLMKGERRRGWIGAAYAYLQTAAVAGVLEYKFFARYHYGALIKNEEAMRAYGIFTACNFLKGLTFLLVVGFFIWKMRQVVAQHTGYVLGKSAYADGEEKTALALHRELNRGLLLAGGAAVLYVLADLAYDLWIPYYNFLLAVPMLLGILCIAAFIRAMSAIQQAVETKYMLE